VLEAEPALVRIAVYWNEVAEHWEDARERHDGAWWNVMADLFASGHTPLVDSA
jgi:hypothetical protein